MRLRAVVPIGMLLLAAGCGSAGDAGPMTSQLVRANVPRASASVSHADAATLRDGSSLFAGRLLADAARGRPNVALSPASISEALAMAFAGARGATASQMASALDFSLPGDRLGAAFNAADRSLEGVNGPDATLNVANAHLRPGGTALPPGIPARARARLRRRPADRRLRACGRGGPGGDQRLGVRADQQERSRSCWGRAMSRNRRG